MPETYGWTCPRCNKIHAPWVASCPCSLEYPTYWTPPYIYPLPEQWLEPTFPTYPYTFSSKTAEID